MALLSASGTSVTTNETEATPQIKALARALDNDPKQIYEYVRNHIAYDPPIYGLHNGANGCLMAGRGNDWDQAALLTSLLRTAGYTTRFGCGLVKYRRADLGAWLGVQSDAVTNVIPTGGNPGGWIYGDSTNYLMQRVWVEAQIGGTWFTLDPAFKTYQNFQRPDIRAAMGYTESAFLTSVTNGATITTDYIKNANETNIAACLTSYTTNLVRFIQTNNPLMTVQQLIGGRQLLSETLSAYPTNLPKAISFWATPDTWDHIPVGNNVTLRVQHAGIDKTFNGYEIAGKRLSLYYDSTNGFRPQLRLAGTVVATGNVTTVGSTNTLSVWVDHPYATAGYGDSSNGFKMVSGNRYVIMHDFEGISPKVIAVANNQLARDIASGLSTNAESVFAGGLEVTALSGLQQWHLSRLLFSQLSDVVGYAHHFIGIIAQENGYYVDIPGVSVSVNSGIQSNADEKAWFKAVTLYASALEHGTLEESQGSDKKCASTIKLLQISNANGKKSFLATSANWSSMVKTALVNYATSQKSQIEASINAGHTFVLPEDGKITNQQWVGLGYVDYYEDALNWGMGMTISGGYNGGYAGTTGPFNVNSSVNTVSTTYTYWPSANVPATTGADPVDLNTGNFIVERADITIGNGQGLGGLTLARNYNSGQNYRKAAMGYGWTHNYDIGVTTVSQGDPAFGLRRPEDATPLIAQSIITLDLMHGTPDVHDWVAASLATKWGMDQVINNSAIVRFGARSLEFVKLPDGSYVAPSGVTTTLSKQGASFALQERFGATYTFNSNGTVSVWRDVDSNSVNFVYDASTNLTTVSNSFGRSFAFTYTNGIITKVSDNASRSVSYAYTSNNLTSMLDLGSNTWTMTYDTNRCLVTMCDPLARLTISNTYDSVSKVQSQINGASNVWNFFVSGWRGVEEDPQGGRTIHFFDDDGRNLGTQDALSNRTYRVYDSQGHLVTNIDARGSTAVFQYDDNHNITNRIDALTNRTAYAYDIGFHLTSVTDPLVNITRYGYDSKHHMTNVVDALSNVTSMTYYSSGLPQSTVAGGRTVSYTYNSAGMLASITRTDGGTVSNQYNAWGDVTAVVDANVQTNSFTYDKRRLLTSGRDALGAVASNVYDSAESRIKAIDRNGNTNQFVWTPTRNIFMEILPNGGTNLFGYDSRDRLCAFTDPLGHVTSNRYDMAGRLIGTVNSLGKETWFALDQNGNVIAVTNALGHVAHTQYDSLNRATNVWDVVGGTTRSVSSVFDVGGRLISTTDADGYRAQFQFDALGRRTATIKPDGVTEHFERDRFGNLTAYVNGESRRMTMTFDGMNRQRSVTDPLSNRVSRVFDATGNFLAQTNANGAVIQYQYNAVNSLQKTIYPGGGTNTFSYNKNRALTNAVNALGGTGIAYNNMNWPSQSVSVVGAFTSTVAYVYDLKGNRTRVVYPGGLTVTNTFDNADQLVSVADWGGRTVNYTYNAVHSPTGTVYPNGVTSAFTWDEASRLTGVAYAINGGAFVDRDFVLDAVGDRLQEDVTAGLLPVLSPNINRLTQDAADRLTAINSKTYPDSATWTTTVPTNDLNGNMLADGAGMTMGYDSDNRVTNLQSAIIGSRSFFYSGDGKVAKRIVNGVTYIDVFDGSRLLMTCASNSAVLVYYVWGKGLISQVGSNGVVFYAHADGQGNVLALTSTNGTVTDQWFYSPYGTTLNRTGTTDIMFQWLGGGGVVAEGGGVYRMPYRLYHSSLMRFTSSDPLGLAGGANLFSYGNGNPLYWVDMLGLCGESIGSLMWGEFAQQNRVIGGMIGISVGTLISSVGNMMALPDRIMDGVTGTTPESRMAWAARAPIPYDDAVVGTLGAVGIFGGSLRMEGMALSRVAGSEVQAYEVGAANVLRARSVAGDTLDIHHVGQATPLEQLIPGYSRATGPAIALPEIEHGLIPTIRGTTTMTPRDILATDIRNLRNFSETPNSSLQQLIQLNQQMYPEVFTR